MPASYQIDITVRVIFSKAEGLLTDEDLLTHQNRLRVDPAFEWSFDQIYDFSDVTAIDVKDATLRRLVERQPFLDGVKRAFVANSDMTRDMTEKLLAYRDGAVEQAEIFDNMEAARRWLHLDKVRSNPPKP